MTTHPPGDQGPARGPARRSVLAAGLAAGALAGTGAWRSAPGRPAAAAPRSRPYPGLPEGTDTIPQIEHIVVLMMENHSYDNRLGMLRRPGADGFRLGPDGQPLASNPYPDGEIQHAFRMPTTCQLTGHPAQDWLASHVQLDGGRLDGFVRSASGPVAMGYWDQADQPFYYSLARAFPVADRYFCSVLGQTYPNRRYLISATSIGQVDDTTPGPADYPPNGTIFDRLDAHGISWKDYFTTLPTVELFPPLYLKNAGTKVVPIADFFTDAAAGTLPGYCLVEPDYGTQSEENPQNIAVGEEFAASVINAVINGPAWDRTVLLLTYDEHGGYYDHVPPPPACPPDGIGPTGARRAGALRRVRQLRLPGAVRGSLAVGTARLRLTRSQRPHQHLRADRDQVEPARLTYRDANADRHAGHARPSPARIRHPPALAQPLAAADPAALTCSVTGPGTIPPPGLGLAAARMSPGAQGR